jgi:hypothetical protein
VIARPAALSLQPAGDARLSLWAEDAVDTLCAWFRPDYQINQPARERIPIFRNIAEI